MSLASFNFTGSPSFNTTANAPTPFAPSPKFGSLGHRTVQSGPVPSGPRANAPGKRQKATHHHWLTREERAERARKHLNKLGMLPKMPPDLQQLATSQARRNLPGIFNPFQWGDQLYETAVQIGVIQPRNWPSMRDFDAAAAASKFLCARMGKPCVARPGESLKGKTVVIGYLLDDKDDIAACRELVARNLRPDDRVLCGVSRTELQDPAVRDAACFGAPQEQSIAVAESDMSARTGEAMIKLADLALQRLRLIDPEYARELEETHRSLHTEATARLSEYQNAASQLSHLTPRENRKAVDRLKREINEASDEFLSISREETPARTALYAEQMRTLSDGERTIYVAAPMAVADQLQAEFLDNPDVVVVCPRNSAERWSRAMGNRM
jgi:hypothetical protein